MMLVALAALTVASVALWVRRDTWRTRWDTAATLNVALQSLNVALLYPRVSWHVSPRLHVVTGMWNVEDLIGHAAYLAGLASLMYMAVTRIKMTDAERRLYLKQRLGLPAAVFLPLLIGFFMASGGTSYYVADLHFIQVTGVLMCYWLLFIGGSVYLLATTASMLLVIRRDPRSTDVVDMYLGAIGVSFCSFAAAIASFAIDGFNMVTWMLIRAEVIAYALVAAYSWRRRIAILHGRWPRETERQR